MARHTQTAAEYIEANALLVPAVLGDMIEHLGHAAQEWSLAVWAAQKGDLEKSLRHVVEVGIDVDVFLKAGRTNVRAIVERAGHKSDAELPDPDDAYQESVGFPELDLVAFRVMDAREPADARRIPLGIRDDLDALGFQRGLEGIESLDPQVEHPLLLGRRS